MPQSSVDPFDVDAAVEIINGRFDTVSPVNSPLHIQP